MDPQNQEGVMERQGSCLLLRCASQNSLDESSQKHISQLHSHSKERPPYKNHLHTQKAFDIMNVMRKQKLLCDVTLVANDVEIPAHKMVLAACSPYFYAMFSSFEESRQDRIVLQEVDHQALSLLVEYVYTSEIHVTEENVQVLLPAANLLQLTDVRDACCDFLQAQLHPTNCLGIRAFADLHGCLELLSHAESYIELHFPEVVECEEFLTLSHQHVSKLICSDRLTVPSEEKVFECVIAWVQHDLETRHKHLASLMEHVRLPLMSQDYLVQRVEEEPLLKADIQCKDYLIEALKYHLLKDHRFNPKHCRIFSKCVEIKHYVFIQVGGFNGSLRVKTVDVYDPALDTWSSCDSMEARRSTLGVAVLEGKIYAVGGYDGASRQCLSSVECYTPEIDTWTSVPDMCSRRSGAGVGVLEGILYAVGGHDGPLVRKSVEAYDPSKSKWTPVSDMALCRRNAGVVAMNGLLYVVGGDDGSCNLSSVSSSNSSSSLFIP
nr:unnamed protein product [Callosobruchus analis]